MTQTKVTTGIVLGLVTIAATVFVVIDGPGWVSDEDRPPVQSPGTATPKFTSDDDPTVPALPVQEVWLGQWLSAPRYALSLSDGRLARHERGQIGRDDPQGSLKPIGDLAWWQRASPQFIVGSGRAAVLAGDPSQLANRDLSTQLGQMAYVQGDVVKPGGVLLVQTTQDHYALVYIAAIKSRSGGQQQAWLAWIYQSDGNARFSRSSVNALFDRGQAMSAAAHAVPPQALVHGRTVLHGQGAPQANALDLAAGHAIPAPAQKPDASVYVKAMEDPDGLAARKIRAYGTAMAEACDLFYDQQGQRLWAGSGRIRSLDDLSADTLNALDDQYLFSPDAGASQSKRTGPRSIRSYQTRPGCDLAFQTRNGHWVIARVLERSEGELSIAWVMQPDRSSRFPGIADLLPEPVGGTASEPPVQLLYRLVQNPGLPTDELAIQIQEMVQAGADLAAQVEPVGDTTLHMAAMYGSPAVVQAILEADVDVDVRSRGGATPLHYAAAMGRLDNAKVLLERGADPLAQTAQGRTPIQEALRARPGNKELVELLTSRAQSTKSAMPLHTAAEVGDERAVGEALKRGEPVDGVDRLGRTPLLLAASQGHVAVTQLLLQAGAKAFAPASSGQWSPFMGAVKQGRVAVIQAMLTDSPAVDPKVVLKAFDLAIRLNNTAMTQKLFAALEDEQARKQAQLLALQFGSEPLIRSMVDDVSTIPAWAGARFAKTDILQQALKADADLSAYNHEGMAALHVAVQFGNVRAVKLLLKAGAKVNQPSHGQQMTALHLAASQGRADIAQLLIDEGAVINATSKIGGTALYYAVLSRNVPTAKLLLDRRAKVEDVPELSTRSSLLRMAQGNEQMLAVLQQE